MKPKTIIFIILDVLFILTALVFWYEQYQSYEAGVAAAATAAQAAQKIQIESQQAWDQIYFQDCLENAGDYPGPVQMIHIYDEFPQDMSIASQSIDCFDQFSNNDNSWN